MKVLLIKDVKDLGKAGEIKEVSDGYGKNFLIGKGLAQHATNEVLKKYEAAQKKKAAQEAEEIENAKQIAQNFKNLKIKLVHKTGANGALFGAITKDEIAHALAEQHKIEIDKKDINLKNPIKATGSYEVDVKLGHAIHGILHVEVESI